MRCSRVRMRCSRVWMRCRRVWMRCSQVWMRCKPRGRASENQCRSRNCPGFDPNILRHSGISGAADEAVLNKVHTLQKIPKKLYSDTPDRRSIRSWRHCSSRALPCSSPTTRLKADLTWVKTSNSRFATRFFSYFYLIFLLWSGEYRG